ncbi:MAG TPA: glycosyltransferase [Candidatus Acidoferrales bacterium]|jgi:glycosyltransferase involved in cell wall biosynthesis
MGFAGEESSALPEDSGIAKIVTLEKNRRYGLWKVLRGLAGPVPVTVLNCWSPRMVGELLHGCRLQKFETVQIEGVHLMEYLPAIRSSLGSPRVVVDWHNIESELMWRYAGNGVNFLKKAAAARTAKLIERAEDRLLDTADVHTVTSERERKKLWARRPNANIRVVPNGVDAAHFSAREILEASLRARPNSHAEDSKPSILFVGSMDYHANIDAVLWFSRTVWPEIARNYPQIRFTIVGRDPAPEIRRLASERIHVTGKVDDVRPYYASAIATVVPLRAGSGTRLKILESMAAEVPIVSTRLGAEGIDAEDNVHLLLADDGAEIAAAIGQIISSAETRNRLTIAARKLVTSRYDWSAIGEQLYRIHCELLRERGRHSVPQESEA